MGEQQPAIGHLVDDGRGGIDRDRHRIDVIARIAADQADRVPVLRQPRRVGRLQHIDDVGQARAHASTSATASTSTRQSGRTAARRNCPSSPTKVSQRRTAIPLASNRFRINSASGTLNRTNGAQPSTTVSADRGQARHHLVAQLRQPPRTCIGLGDRLRRAAGRDRLQLKGAQRPMGAPCCQPLEHVGCAQRVADPQPGHRPRLGQAAQHHHVGQRVAGQALVLAGNGVGERLVDHHDATRRCATPESDPRGWSTEVGLVGLPTTTRSASSGTTASARSYGGASTTCRSVYPGGRQRRLGLGERRRDQRRQRRPQVGQQREALGRPGQQRHLVAAAAVPGGHGVDCPLFVVGARVAAQVREPRRQPLDQPGGRLGGPHVDGEVQHARTRSLVAVVAGGRAGSTCHITTVVRRRRQWTRDDTG